MPVDAKICGLKDAAAAEAAHDAGAAYLGFIFHEASPRHLTLAEAEALARILPRLARTVAVTVDATDDTLGAIIGAFSPSLLQLHGNESVERTGDVRRRFGLPVIKALGVATAADIARADAYEPAADFLMFDTKIAGEASGGTGKSFDWSLLSDYKGKAPWFLSGGLAAENAAEAVATSGARLLDASSRLESAPGVKDIARIHAFLDEVERLP